MDPNSKLRVDAHVENLIKIRNFVQQTTSALGVAQEQIDDVILAVDEVATNIIVHGYKGQPGMIDIEVSRESDSLLLRLQDQAPGFDPTQVPSPDVTLPLEKRPLGKLGIHLVRHMVDEIIYKIPSGRGNQLTLVKHISD
jgi:serine/threonine-protein kinase RsbW